MLKKMLHFGRNSLAVVRNEKGAQAIEYVGLVAIVVILIVALLPLFGGDGDDSIAKMLVDKIKEFINQIDI
ncbi:Flp family type IVb pilin [Paenibacillus sp. strain BS8-2]